MWWTSGTSPPLYLKVYCSLIQYATSSAYAGLSFAALTLAGAKNFLPVGKEMEMADSPDNHSSPTNVNCWTTKFSVEAPEDGLAITSTVRGPWTAYAAAIISRPDRPINPEPGHIPNIDLHGRFPSPPAQMAKQSVGFSQYLLMKLNHAGKSSKTKKIRL